jgi:hypothetical protein
MIHQKKAGKPAAGYAEPSSGRTNSLAQKRETAAENARVRRNDVGAPPRIRSKRDRSANQENR